MEKQIWQIIRSKLNDFFIQRVETSIQKLAKELDIVIKQKDELQEKLNNINKISIIENGKTNLADDQIKTK